jgi:hypothetical protein
MIVKNPELIELENIVSQCEQSFHWLTYFNDSENPKFIPFISGKKMNASRHKVWNV